MENSHQNEIPEDMSTAQFLYFKVHGREYGLCRVCGKPTPWNEKAGKPSQNCGSKACKEKIREIPNSIISFTQTSKPNKEEIIEEINMFLNSYYKEYTGFYLKSKKFLENVKSD